MTATPRLSRAPPAASSKPSSAPESASLERILGIERRLDPVFGIGFEEPGGASVPAVRFFGGCVCGGRLMPADLGCRPPTGSANPATIPSSPAAVRIPEARLH